MDDKFILMGLNDENSKKVAEVLQNKTAKKILDYLGDVKEASEKDIADGLNMAMNTAEYNLKKLIEVGLVEKTKNFFWSVKGKKIPMYKLAKKHIIISPHKNPSLDSLKAILPVVGVIAIIAVIFGVVYSLNYQENNLNWESLSGLQKFGSYTELKNFLDENVGSGTFGSYYSTRSNMIMEESAVSGDASGGAPAPTASIAKDSAQSATDYSQTNVQVEGVDEADIVKNDGEYIYVVQGKKVIIVDAFPAEDMKIVDEIDFENYPSNIFINGDKLVVFVNEYNYYETGVPCGEFFDIGVRCGGYSKTTTNVYLYDISDRTDAELEESYELDGDYSNSRMVGDFVYVIATKYIDTSFLDLPVHVMNGVEKKIAADEVYYFDTPDQNYIFTTIAAIDLSSGESDTETYMIGASNTMYMSEENIYLVYQKQLSQRYYFERFVNEVLIPSLPNSVAGEVEEVMDSDDSYREQSKKIGEIFEDYRQGLSMSELQDFLTDFQKRSETFYEDVAKQREMTVINKIGVDGLSVDYKAQGEVPGRVLNQFSMDEFEGNFRIATTTGGWNRDKNENNLYVLNGDLETIGKVEDLAKGEQIYSTRFMGEKAYLVTFRQTDPLFVIDLSNPEEPKVLGELKITGYSGYLHPYDENHLLGIGMEATETGRTTGVKVTLFDVTDMSDPKEVDSYEVTQGQWSSSEAVYDHKAVLFDKEKNLLVIPVSYNKEIGVADGRYSYPIYEYWQGAFVFDVDLQGIDLKGKISHQEKETSEYWYGGGYVKRSLFMDDVLYTISDQKVKANELNTLDEIEEISLPVEDYYPGPYYGGGVAVSEPVMVE